MTALSPTEQQASALPAKSQSTALQNNALMEPGFSSPQKAALILAALGPPAAGPIIERIADKHLRAFARAYAHLQAVPKPALEKVALEFIQRLSKDDSVIKGGLEETRELLSQFFSADNITRLMDDIDLPGGESVWEKIERADDDAVSAYLAEQQPQFNAVVLSKISTEKASSVLNLMDDETAKEVILRLSKPLRINPRALSVVSETIERQFLAPMRQTRKARNPGLMIGSMMNNIASDKRNALLSFIAESVPDIERDVKRSMLTFQDFSERVPAKAVTLAIKAVEVEEFLQAMKFGKQNAPSTVEFIFANISKRMLQQYEEQMEALKPISVKEAEVMQAKLMSAVRKLAASGEFELIEPASDDEDETS